MQIDYVKICASSTICSKTPHAFLVPQIQIHNLFDNDDLATVIDEFADDFGPLLVDILVNDTRRDLLPTIIDELNDLLWNASIPLAERSNVEHFRRWVRCDNV